MFGGGFLKQMNDSLKYNRDLLGKRKSLREVYKEEIRRTSGSYTGEHLESIRVRVTERISKSKKRDAIARILTLIAFCIIVCCMVLVYSSIDFKARRKEKYEDKTKLFTTFRGRLPNGLEQKVDYFKKGGKAASTYFKKGLRHQNSESFYEAGEQFRSALYFYDTLITDIYFFRTGDTIPNFPAVYDDNVHHLIINDPKRAQVIEFDFYDGKIIQGTYRTTPAQQNPDYRKPM